MNRTVIATEKAPAAIGAYSQAVSGGALLFCSGQIALGVDSSDLVGATAAEQATQCLRNLEEICAAAGSRLSRALKTTIYLTDLEDFGEVNEAYSSFFETAPPARATIGVAELPMGAKVEIEAIVALG
jgi:2-iminobutanoate/2-iminopropanoate deaminase